MWARILTAAIGIWLMAAPAVLGYGTPAATSDRIVGPVLAAFAITAIWEVTRALRWVGLPLGAWLVLAPFVLGYDATAPFVSSIVSGVFVIVLTFVRGRLDERFDGGWRMVWKGDRPHPR